MGTIAERVTEPADKTRVVIEKLDQFGESVPEVIWRDDTEAAKWGSEHEDERWFSQPSSDPMSWPNIVGHAVSIHAVDPTPLAHI